MPESVSSDEGDGGLNIFQDPEGFYKPEKQPTFVQHRMLDGRELNLRLVGHNPLWVGGKILLSLIWSPCFSILQRGVPEERKKKGCSLRKTHL